jgi:hypothetical protein
MKLGQPIVLSIKKTTDNLEPVHLFGWNLNEEKGVIEVAVNTNVKIESPVSSISYKDIMLDMISSKTPLRVASTFINSDDEDFIGLGAITVHTRTKEGNTAVCQMLLCDFISLFQYQSNIVKIDAEYVISPIVEVVLSNLKKNAQVNFYPAAKQTWEEFNFVPNPNPRPDEDVQLGCMTWIILKNNSSSIEKLKFILQSHTQDLDNPVRIKIDNPNISIVEAMPTYLTDEPGLFSIHPTRRVLHKMYSTTSHQVTQHITFHSTNSPFLYRPGISPYQTQPGLIKTDLDLDEILSDRKSGELIAEMEMLPNANLVLFFTDKKPDSKVN